MRRTWGIAQYPTELGEHLSWWLAYYHFARYHEILQVKLDQAMARNGDHPEAMECTGIDQLSTAVI
jgi:hypothetical protein